MAVAGILSAVRRGFVRFRCAGLSGAGGVRGRRRVLRSSEDVRECGRFGLRFLDTRFAQACELVAQGARADTEPLGRNLAVARRFAQRVDDTQLFLLAQIVL